MATLRLGSGKAEPEEVLTRLRAAVVELTSIDEESGGAIDLSFAIETLRQAIRELEEAH
jgi:ABC-type hemin transport system substrate-binding protein